ncbi:MAG: hypothetical protein OJF55_000616 [Rhodanobacteraceae bacterium]|nr:MAG: hypothetical protein OJF55_000616 [Rhodanobacteraceae bacterium]
MRWRKYTVLFALFVLCLVFDAWVYGSLSLEPNVGPALTSAARANAPLLHGYIVLGTPLAKQVGTAAGQRVADAAFHDAYPAMIALPAAADSLLFSRSQGPWRRLLIPLYWATPVLLVLALLAWALRSRQTHLMGRARR